MNGTLTASTTKLQAKLLGSTTPVGSLAYVFFGGRRIWTFRVGAGHWDISSNMLSVDWPAALVPHLAGVCGTRLEIRTEPAHPASYTAEGTMDFGGSAEELKLVDSLTGSDLVVNKWGRLAPSFEAADEELKQNVLKSAHDLMAYLKETLGLELFLTGGTLLGLVRDGKLISSDDDADLAYLSAHENPSDVVLESFAIERALAENGLESVRHSSGHLQVMFGGSVYTDGFHVDIFTYFVANDWFYGTFHAREKAKDVTVYPLGTLEHNGLILPVPANTEQMLTAIYGPSWHTPDPAFTFVTPESAGRRFYWWLNHFDQFREDWEDFHRSLIGAGESPAPSALAGWLAAELAPGSTVLELGCGMGSDALALAVAGHKVLACDYSRPAVAHGTLLASSPKVDAISSPVSTVQFEVANVNSVRHLAQVVKGAADLAGPGMPVNVVARNLFDNLHYLGRDNALLAISHLLDRGGRAYLQIRNPKFRRDAQAMSEPIGERVFEPWEFTGRLSHYGLEIVESNFFDEPDSAGTSLSYILGKVLK